MSSVTTGRIELHSTILEKLGYDPLPHYVEPKIPAELLTVAEKSDYKATSKSAEVIELVLEKSAYGWRLEEIHFQHPYLSLDQIHSALAYYWDHQTELDEDIKKMNDSQILSCAGELGRVLFTQFYCTSSN